jgi:hypothetical protein
MGLVSDKLRNWKSAERSGYSFLCPRCGGVHAIHTSPDGWTFNGDVHRPTFSPSVLVRIGHHAPHFKEGDNCWCSYNAEQEAKGEAPAPFRCGICHSYVTEGRIQFLGDCTHALAGQTVELPDFPWRANESD